MNMKKSSSCKHLRMYFCILMLLFGSICISLSQKEVQAANTGFQTINGKTYYIKSNGQKQKGWLTLKGKKYYFNKTTGVQVKGWVKNSSGKVIRYFTKGAGYMVTGFLKDSSGNVRYFDKETGLLVRGWMKNAAGEKYYFTSGSGVMAKGWFTDSKGNKRYFNKTSGKMITGWVTVSSGKKRYFSKSSGIMVTGWQKASNGNRRYFDKSTGYMLTGMKQIDGYTYYFAKSNGVLYQKGFGTLSGKKYYFNPDNGRMCTGWLTLNGKKYYFASDGVMYVNKTAEIDGTTYIFDADGVAQVYTWDETELQITNTNYNSSEIQVYDTKNKKTYRLHKNYLTHQGVANGEASDLDILAAICEAEAGDQGSIGMQAVALCILNRTIDPNKEFPSSIRGVIYQTGPLQYAVIVNTSSGQPGTLERRLTNQLWYNKEAAYEAASKAMKIFDAYLKEGKPRTLSGFDREDFNFRYFMMDYTYWTMPLNFNKVDNFQYKDHMFFVDWV